MGSWDGESAEGFGAGLWECGDPKRQSWQWMRETVPHGLGSERTWTQDLDANFSCTHMLCDEWTHLLFLRLGFHNWKCPCHRVVVWIKGDAADERAWLSPGTREISPSVSQKHVSFIFSHLRFETASFRSSSRLSPPPVLPKDGHFCIQGLPGPLGFEYWLSKRIIPPLHSINLAFICSQWEQPVWFLDINTLNKQDRPHWVI